jgi:hypothetical protein
MACKDRCIFVVVRLFTIMCAAVTELYWTQNIFEPELRHSKRGVEDGKSKGGRKTPYALSLPLPPRTTAG